MQDPPTKSDKVETIPSKSIQVFEDGVFINLNEEISQLLADPSFKDEQGRRSKMFVKSAELKMVLVVMKAQSRWDDHKTPSRISVQVLRGLIRFHTPGRSYDLHPGELLELSPGVLHSVTSVEESAFLLTLGTAM